MRASIAAFTITVSLAVLPACGSVQKTSQAEGTPKGAVPPPPAAIRKAEDVVYMLSGISLDDAKTWARRESLVIIDCRAPENFQKGHIPGALSLPEKTSLEWIDDFAQKYERAAPLLVYCESDECPSAMDLSVLFLRYGFTNVRYLECGYYGWQEAGEPDLGGRVVK